MDVNLEIVYEAWIKAVCTHEIANEIAENKKKTKWGPKPWKALTIIGSDKEKNERENEQPIRQTMTNKQTK